MEPLTGRIHLSGGAVLNASVWTNHKILRGVTPAMKVARLTIAAQGLRVPRLYMRHVSLLSSAIFILGSVNFSRRCISFARPASNEDHIGKPKPL
jgi:hypothetical protein